MNIEYLVKEKTNYIKWFYKTAVEPFSKIKEAVEKEKEPYVPPSGEADEPPFLEEWIKAEYGVQIIGHTCISILSGILKLYLELWKERWEDGGRRRPSDAATNKDDWTAINKKYWPARVLKKLEELGCDVSSCPVDTSIMEQIVLCRNRIQHPDCDRIQHPGSFFLTFLGIRYSREDINRFSKPLFSNKLELEMFGGDFKPDKFMFMRPSVFSTEKNIFEAISQVEDFFSWLESEYERIIKEK